MHGVLFPRPPSVSLPSTIIQFFVYSRADVTASGQLQRRHKYEKKTANNCDRGKAGTDRRTLRLTFKYDIQLCYGSTKYKMYTSQNTTIFRQDNLCV